MTAVTLSLKEKVLLTFYDAFERWAAPLPRVCAKGCSVCCTRNVMITALEGERILDFIRQRGMETWCADLLQTIPPIAPPALTSNEYASACLQQIELSDTPAPESDAPCPFLETGCCAIYPVRPFACRCFLSESPCKSEETAILPQYYLAAATVMMQFIEHLGQNDYWGSMPDVLLALCDILKYKRLAGLFPEPSIFIQARIRTRRARPLPGLLLLDGEYARVSPLIDHIFSTRIDGRRIRDILNGTGRRDSTDGGK